VHFKSRDLSRLHRQGQFWHIFFTSGHVIISQDEVDTWTAHTPLPLDFDTSTLDPKEAVYRVLGGSGDPSPIEIDEVLVTSSWRPNICIAERYISAKGRVFLSGDSAHQNIPTGGYGMNTAVGDSFDIGWKLAAVLAGHGGAGALLQSYESERRPVAARNIERSGVHWSQHSFYKDLVEQTGDAVRARTPQGEDLRRQIARHLGTHDGENKDHGIELGYRYNGSGVIIPDGDGTEEPPWKYEAYIPSTWPGARAPHVFLKDGTTSVFDLFGQGPEYTLLDFTPAGRYIAAFGPEAAKLAIPLKSVHLPDEPHVKKIWERDAVLVRPDDHVAWRASGSGGSGDKGPEGVDVDVTKVLLTVVGKGDISESGANNNPRGAGAEIAKVKETGFTGTIGNVDQESVQHLASFQR
jgi:FAD-dependent monooxygenase